MTTDSHYAIGKSHLVCQDVARHVNGEHPFIIVCDGCSGSPQTELGAQILAQAMVKEQERWFCGSLLQSLGIREFALSGLWEASAVGGKLGVDDLAFDATIMLGWRTATHVLTSIWGDGAIMWRQRSGRRVLVSIEFKKGAPAYLSYRLDPKRMAGYLEKTEDGLRMVSTYEDTGKGFELTASYEDTGMDPFRLDFPIEDVDLVLLASDGLGSFQRRVDSYFEPVPICEVAEKAFGFKGMAGSFVARRMRRFLTVEAPALGWHHDDDLSVAAIHVGEK